MKMHFSMVINGTDNIDEKFQTSLSANPELQMNLIRAFADTIMVAFRFNKEDAIAIESFRAGKIDEPKVEPEIKNPILLADAEVIPIKKNKREASKT